MTIGFECSEKLISVLSEKVKKNDNISLNDMIEEAILNYYNISLIELNECVEHLYVDNILLSTLNKTKSLKEASLILNISTRTLQRKIKKSNIIKDKINNIFYIKILK